MISGPRGIGKATLAYRFARFLLHRHLATSSLDGLNVDPGDPVSRLVAAGSHPDLFVLERLFDAKIGRLRIETGVDIARDAAGFFSRSAAMGGWRVCIVDPADDLNLEAANALLKILEEPPLRSIFLLVCHRPGTVLRTIRSRCLRLPLWPLKQQQVVTVLHKVLGEEAPIETEMARAAELSQGSPGRALQLLGSNGARTFAEFKNVVSGLPSINHRQALGLADKLQSRAAEEEFVVFCELLSAWIADRARTEALAERSEARKWAEVHLELSHSIRDTNTLNLDRRQLVMHAFEALQEAARHRQN
jgi:DNA polymerase-3 subunit delta'